mgnify:CR=1 FL=1
MNRKKSYKNHKIVELKSAKLDIRDAEKYIPYKIKGKYVSIVLVTPGIIDSKYDIFSGIGSTKEKAFEDSISKCINKIDIKSEK